MHVKLQFDDSSEVADGTCKNVSIGGMHVVTDSPRPQGSTLRFELDIGDEVNVRGIGEVVWMRAESAGPGREAGMGVKFRFLEQRDRQIIFKIVSEHIKERLEHRHPGTPGPVTQRMSPARMPAAPEPAAPEPAAPQPATPEPAAPQPFFSDPPPLPEPVVEPEPEPVADELLPALDDLTAPEDERSYEALAPPSYPDSFDVDVPLTEEPRFDEPRFDEPLSEEPLSEEPLSEELPSEELPSEEALSDGLLTREPGTHEPLAEGPPLSPTSTSDTGVYYRHRPAPRRDFPILPVVALLLVAAAAAAYLGWDRIFGPSTPSPPPGAAPAAVAPDAGAPETGPPPDAPTERPVDEAPPISVETDPVTPPPPLPAPPPPPPPPAALAEFTRVVDVSWTRQPGGVKVEIETDGVIPAGRYDSFRLDGENPREVVRLKGVAARYGTSEIKVTGSPVSRIRIGYHANRELHIVLDMLDRSTRIQRMRTQGSTLEVFVE